MNTAASLIALAGLAALAPPLATSAVPKEGRYDITTCWSGTSTTIEHSKEHTASSFEMTGTVMSNPPGGLFHLNTFRCVGAASSLGGKRTNTTVCETVDSEGDRRVSLFLLSPDGKTVRENVTGTGKYEGMVASGTVQSLGPFPAIKPGTFQNCNNQTGTYKLR